MDQTDQTLKGTLSSRCVADPAASETIDEYGVPFGCTHFVEFIFGSVQFLQYRKTERIGYFAEYQGERWIPMGTQPSALGITPQDIAGYAKGLPRDEFESVMHAIWLTDGEASGAAQLLGLSEERIWQMNAGQADAAFCSRPTTWGPDVSRDYLLRKGYAIANSENALLVPQSLGM